jgi:predicted lipoprotein with Yx(FWY)xxD motif
VCTAVTAFVGLAAGCGDGGPGATAGTDTGPTTSTAPAITVIEVAYNELLEEQIVVDGDGRTVYMFTIDTPNTAKCTPDLPGHPLCHRVLPPVTGTPRAGTGIDSSLLGTTTRSDGIVQVTYNGHPLYYFNDGLGYGEPDQNPGDIGGQGFFRMFWVLAPDGAPLTT